jgi:hypothetical protein
MWRPSVPHPRIVSIEPLGPQMATFFAGRLPNVKVISITTRDAAEIVTRLEAQGNPTARSAAANIAQGTRLGEAEDIELAIGEDEEVIAALDELRSERGSLRSTLTRLENALRAKIDSES